MVKWDAVRMFDESAGIYDRVNSVISLGLDKRWRAWAADRAVWKGNARVLDAFAGAGEAGIRAAAKGARVTLADASGAMLAMARERTAGAGLEVETSLTDLTAERLPFAERCFDSIVIVFGLRYVDDPTALLANLSTLLKPDGRVVTVEFVAAPPGFPATPASFYFFRILPSVGGFLAGRRDLYDYLTSSVRAFGTAREMRTMIQAAGLSVIQEKTMGFGLVEGIVAVCG
ncbi:MAG: class I SAM-dependent methyltransferase [Candidatus Aquicultorales bacterium]